MSKPHSVVAINPCNGLDETQAFYERLGFTAITDYPAQGYRILGDSKGASVHLTPTAPGWGVPERNPFGIYFYSEDVEELAASFGRKPVEQPWGLKEFAVSDPNGTLVRVGWQVLPTQSVMSPSHP